MIGKLNHIAIAVPDLAKAIALYRDLLAKAEGRSIVLEEYARTHIGAEELHVGEIEKMLRHPGH